MSYDIEGIRKANRRISKFVKLNSRRPSLKAIHNLRTGTRHLETIFATLGLDSKRSVKRLLADLENVRKRAGKVRDMDVLTADVLTVKQKGEQDCLVQLLEHLGSQRNKYATKLRREIEDLKPDLRRNLQRTCKRVEQLLKESENHSPDSNAMPATVAKVIALSLALKKPARLTRTSLHPYRLRVKELRDVLQLSEQGADAELVEKLREVKDAIGEWHDWEELLSIARPLLDHGPACNLIKHLTGTSKSRYERALSLTHDLRNKYLSPKAKKRRTRRAKAPLVSLPVIEAVAAIAGQ